MLKRIDEKEIRSLSWRAAAKSSAVVVVIGVLVAGVKAFLGSKIYWVDLIPGTIILAVVTGGAGWTLTRIKWTEYNKWVERKLRGNSQSNRTFRGF